MCFVVVEQSSPQFKVIKLPLSSSSDSFLLLPLQYSMLYWFLFSQIRKGGGEADRTDGGWERRGTHHQMRLSMVDFDKCGWEARTMILLSEMQYWLKCMFSEDRCLHSTMWWMGQPETQKSDWEWGGDLLRVEILNGRFQSPRLQTSIVLHPSHTYHKRLQDVKGWSIGCESHTKWNHAT